MRRYFFGFITTITLLFTLAIGVIRAQPYTTSQLEVFLDPPAGCHAPCFLGVRPHQTTVEQALAILRANEEVSQVHIENTFNGQVIYWRWQSDPSAFRRYAFHIQDRIVTRPIIPLGTTLGELHLALGEPKLVTAAFTNGYVQQPAFIFEYPSGLYVFANAQLCEINQHTFWQLSLQSPSIYNQLFVDLGDPPYFRMRPATRQLLDRHAWAKQARDFCRTARS
jgi:hypothetical protein